MRRLTTGLLAGLLCGLLLALAGRVPVGRLPGARAQEVRKVPLFYPCARDDWDCLNGRDAAIMSYLRVADTDITAAAEASRQARDAQRAAGPSDAHIAAIAADQARSTVREWLLNSQDYLKIGPGHLWYDPGHPTLQPFRWTFDQIFARFKVHVCRAAVPHNTTITCP